MRSSDLRKKGIRVLGIAESFNKERSKYSQIVGVVMRGDFLIDGFALGKITIGGLDSTNVILNMVKDLHRDDIRVIFLSGCIISWFNIIDIDSLYEKLKIPIICITYDDSPGLDRFIKEYFPKDYKIRLKLYDKIRNRESFETWTRYKVFIKTSGLPPEKAKELVNRFIQQGKIPEPTRIARLLARKILNHEYQWDKFKSRSDSSK